ncbi:hypothetical protein Ocin01_03474, partial [Orchesella cincta]
MGRYFPASGRSCLLAVLLLAAYAHAEPLRTARIPILPEESPEIQREIVKRNDQPGQQQQGPPQQQQPQPQQQPPQLPSHNLLQKRHSSAVLLRTIMEGVEVATVAV